MLGIEDLDSVMVDMNNAQQSHVIVNWGSKVGNKSQFFWLGKSFHPSMMVRVNQHPPVHQRGWMVHW
jgi:hypothetical protein